MPYFKEMRLKFSSAINNLAKSSCAPYWSGIFQNQSLSVPVSPCQSRCVTFCTQYRRNEISLTLMFFWRWMFIVANPSWIAYPFGMSFIGFKRDLNAELHTACAIGDCDGVRDLLAAGAQIDALDPRLATPLHTAIESDTLEAVEILLANGANVDARDEHGRSPLNWAVRARLPHMARRLLKDGADVHDLDSKGNDAISMCVQDADVPVAEVLLEFGADIFQCDSGGFTLLHKACKNSQLELAKFFIRNGLSMDAKTKGGSTPLDCDHSGLVSDWWASVQAQNTILDVFGGEQSEVTVSPLRGLAL